MKIEVPEAVALYRLAAEREPEPFKLTPVIPEIVRWRPPSPSRLDLRVVTIEAAE